MVLTEGLPRLEEALDKAAAGDKVVAGDVAFRLYDTYGLPRDFIEDMIDDRKLSLDREGFERAMEGPARQGAREEQVQGRGRARTSHSPASTRCPRRRLRDTTTPR